MPTIAQIAQRNKRDAAKRLRAAQNLAKLARVDALAESGALDSDKPLAERVHAVLLANRPNAAPALPEPVKVAGSPTCPTCKGKGQYTGVNQETGHVGLIRCGCQPAPLYDLIIATRRAAKFTGHGQSNDGRITRIKKAGCDWQELKNTFRLSDPAIIDRLAAYELIDQVCTSTEIWRRYKLTGA